MRQETNNEIDLLLRRLGRRQEAAVSDADFDHLDADELSAFAENALPAAARARYTQHLADCSKCREIVVQLSASVPVVAAKETVTAAAPSGLRNFLASFFSPMVLRYAVPALGLIVVAAIGFIVLQSSSRRAANRVAQLEPRAQSPAPNSNTQQPEAKVFLDSSDKPKESSSPVATRPADPKTVTEAQEPPPPAAPKPAGEVAAATTAAPVQKNEQQPAVANAAAAPPQTSPTPVATVDDMRVDVQGRRNEPVQGRDLAKQKTAEGFHDQDKKTAARERAAAPATAGAGAPRDRADSTFRVAEEAEKAEKDGITRSVMGRRFRKQGGIWIDTAYSSSNAIRDIARGSEAYRALVADEPEIKKFAEELDGPFVVVWKGRTYRIR